MGPKHLSQLCAAVSIITLLLPFAALAGKKKDQAAVASPAVSGTPAPYSPADMSVALYESMQVNGDGSVDAPTVSDPKLKPEVLKVKQQKTDEQKELKKDGDVCADKSETTFQNVLDDSPYFKMVNEQTPNGERVIPQVCKTGNKPQECKNILHEGLSFDKGQLAALLDNKGDDQHDEMKERIIKILHTIDSVAAKAMQYTAISIPLGDGVNAFLGDMNDKLADHLNDKEKGEEAAKVMKTFLSGLLSCKSNMRAPYLDGGIVKNVLEKVFYDLSQNQKVNLGDTPTGAVEQALAILKKPVSGVVNECNTGPLAQAQGGSVDLLTMMSSTKSLFEIGYEDTGPSGLTPAGQTLIQKKTN